MERLKDLILFYSILSNIERNIGGARKLSDCSGRMDWPERDVYFFMESGENRTDSGIGLRIVRVGTHALGAGSGTKLWTRLSQHKGQANTGGGNHRGSIFRLLVGTALLRHHGYEQPTWGSGSTASAEVRADETAVEWEVSQIIGAMPFIWLAIKDDPGPASARAYIECNSIALLSNYKKAVLDPPSECWLGHDCDRERVREAGLWNQNHVNERYDPAFLDRLDRLVLESTQAT
ncbi:MAG TPA: hypothetical protein VMV19_08195 [Xanthobacteraceae bacterium]|nr:hypothetical protein [Xanthobacteraceae bacterium]